jgi:hypothetical protein
MLAHRLRVSRSPANEALALLHQKGVLTREKNRGFSVAKPLVEPLADVVGELELDETDRVPRVYFQIADDLLTGKLPNEFQKRLIRNRYNLLEHEPNEEASEALRQPLLHTLGALSRISGILKP